MALIMSSITQAIHIARVETSRLVLDKMIDFLGEKMEIDDELAGDIEAFKKALVADMEAEAPAVTKVTKKTGKRAAAAGEKKTRAPRKLTLYNLFTQEKMKELREAGVKGDKENGNLMKQATALWAKMTDDEKEAWKTENQDKLDELNTSRSGASSDADSATGSEKLAKKTTSKPKKTTKTTTKVVEEKQPETPKVEEPAEQKKTTTPAPAKTKSSKSAVSRVPDAVTFLKMLHKSKVSADEKDQVKKLVESICAQLTEEVPEGAELKFSFADEFFEAISDEGLLENDEGYALMTAFGEAVQPADEE